MRDLGAGELTRVPWDEPLLAVDALTEDAPLGCVWLALVPAAQRFAQHIVRLQHAVPRSLLGVP